MAYSARIVLDSVSPSGVRLTTMEITYPRFVHSEFMTHRVFSRNSASSRAIPIEKMIERVEKDPVLPVWWGKNQSGMQAKDELCGDARDDAESEWLYARDDAVGRAKELLRLGLHKQIANRLLEPWMWITVLVSATEWQNFFALRCHPDAQPEIQKIAYMMAEARAESSPADRTEIGWLHLPLVIGRDESELLAAGYSLDDLKKISVGRCARVSYLTHEGTRDPQKDIELHDRLAGSGHWSPFEHVAEGMGCRSQIGNFRGWEQYRKTFADENQGPQNGG